jgi:hypothetical protein
MGGRTYAPQSSAHVACALDMDGSRSYQRTSSPTTSIPVHRCMSPLCHCIQYENKSNNLISPYRTVMPVELQK